jgi:hypothetical protein
MTALLRLIGTALLALALAACAIGPAPAVVPLLRLSPAALGQTLALHQRLTVQAQGRSQQLEVALEADADGVRLAVLELGQTVARLEWDGRELQERRAAGWPDAVRGERILSDLQLVYWPAEAIRVALPAGWTLTMQEGARTLQFGELAVVQVRYPAAGAVELENLVERYRIRIDSRPWNTAQ